MYVYIHLCEYVSVCVRKRERGKVSFLSNDVSLFPFQNERVLPLEVLINHQNNEKVLPTENTLIQNKAIKLKIRSNGNKNSGDVDLIIAATKEVQATEQSIDKYSPAFNAQHEFINKENSEEIKSTPKLNPKWDTSRQDSSLFYPSQSEEMFPFLSMGSILQNSQPALLEQNHFSPLQSLRYFESNLQSELLPHINPGLGSFSDVPMGLVLSQPIFTNGISPNMLNHQGLHNTPQLLNSMQQKPIHQTQQNNRNYPLVIPQQVSGVQNPALNRYSLLNGTPQSKSPLLHQNFLQNNPVGNSLQPIQQFSGPQRNQPSLSPQISPVPETLPDILDRNKQPIPLHNRPEYTLGRNHQVINTPIQRNPYQQQPALRELPRPPLNTQEPLNNDVHNNYQTQGLSRPHFNMQKPQNNGVNNYPPNRDHTGPHLNIHGPLNNGFHNHQPNREIPQRAYYAPEGDSQPFNNFPPQQFVPQHRSHPIIGSAQRIPDNQQNLRHRENVQDEPNSRINSYQEQYRPHFRELHPDSSPFNQNNQQHSPHVFPQEHQRNNYENTGFRNGQPEKLSEDDSKVPVYNGPSRESRPLHLQNIPSSDYPHRSSPNSEFNQPQNGLPPNQHEQVHRQSYHEPPYHTQSNDPDVKLSNFNRLNRKAEEVRDAVRQRHRKEKLEDDYSSSAPPKKRKSRNRKRPVSKDKMEDLDEHASHQYIIKIG